jgi:hypothetical protein
LSIVVGFISGHGFSAQEELLTKDSIKQLFIKDYSWLYLILGWIEGDDNWTEIVGEVPFSTASAAIRTILFAFYQKPSLLFTGSRVFASAPMTIINFGDLRFWIDSLIQIQLNLAARKFKDCNDPLES